MNIKNLERAREIAEQLPALEDARTILSSCKAVVMVSTDGKEMNSVTLPRNVNYNIVTVLNAEINRLKEETKGL